MIDDPFETFHYTVGTNGSQGEPIRESTAQLFLMVG